MQDKHRRNCRNIHFFLFCFVLKNPREAKNFRIDCILMLEFLSTLNLFEKCLLLETIFYCKFPSQTSCLSSNRTFQRQLENELFICQETINWRINELVIWIFSTSFSSCKVWIFNLRFFCQHFCGKKLLWTLQDNYCKKL